MKKENYGYVMKFYRIERWLYEHNLTTMAKVVFHTINLIFNCSIPYTCELGQGVIIAHSIGIVIHKNTVIGKGTKIYQNVTIGNKNGPRIGSNCIIGTGAVILGDIVVGDNVKIGANCVVLENVPNNATVVGVPGKVVKINGKRIQKEK